MALALPVAFRTLLTCLFIFVFGFCAENKFFFFYHYSCSETPLVTCSLPNYLQNRHPYALHFLPPMFIMSHAATWFSLPPAPAPAEVNYVPPATVRAATAEK